MDGRRPCRRRAAWAAVVAVVVMAAAVGVGGDFAADKAECSDKLMGLATCLPYVQDQAAAPTPDCCSGLKAVLQASRKCLCVLIKDRDDPGLGLKFNVTKALLLPSLCQASANISDCPRLLNLPPNSKDAEIFDQFARHQGAISTPTATGGGSSAPHTGAQNSGAAAGPRRHRWLGVDGVGGGGALAVVLLLFSSASAAAAVALAAPLLLAL